MEMPRTHSKATPRSSRNSNPMEVISEPLHGDVTLIDLVFVHGLTHNWQQTWGSDGKTWVKDILPKEIPHTRVLTCGNDACRFIQEGSSFSDASCRLLEGFETEREDNKRPLIFVAHSLGGVMLQAFLQQCTVSLRASIKGILFFGTPNYGLHNQGWLDFAAAMSKVDHTIDNKTRSLISNDRYLSDLGSISDSFKRWLPDQAFAREVVCLYELSPVIEDVFIVVKEHAVLPHCDAIGLSADHFEMAKLLMHSGSNFKVVMQCLRSLYCLAEDNMRVLLRHSLGRSLQGRLRNLPVTPDGCEQFIVSTKGSPECRDLGRLGLILEDQGYHKEAEEKFRRAIELLNASRQCSPEAKKLGQCALELEDLSKGTVSDEELGKAVEKFEHQPSPGFDDVAIVFCLNKLASLICQRGKFREAESYSRSCLRASIRISGKGSHSSLLSADNLALSMKYQGRHHDAYYLLWDALESADMTASQDTAHVKLFDTLATLESERGMYDVAVSLSCDAVRRSIWLYGNKHPFTLNCMSNLADVLARNGHTASAEAISRHVLNGLEQSLGTDHPDCLRAACRLAEYIYLQQRYSDASLRLNHVLKMQEMRIGDHHPDTLFTMQSLSVVYKLQGYFKNSEVLFNQALKGQKELFGPEHDYAYTIWTSKPLAKFKEPQAQRFQMEEKVQRELRELFVSVPRVATEANSRHSAYTNSPFQNPTEGHLFQLATCSDKGTLRSMLKEERMDKSTLGRALREAAAAGQAMTVQLLLECEAPKDATSAFHGTALQAASFFGSETVVKFLLESKAGVNQEGGRFGNALRAAVLGRHTVIVGLLLDSDRSEKVSREILNSAMQLALLTKETDIIRQLLRAGGDINSIDNLFGSPLQQALFFGREDVIKILLKDGVHMDLQAGIVGSLLQEAIQSQNKSAMERLFGTRANVNSACNQPDKSMLGESGLSSSGMDVDTNFLPEKHVDSFQYIPHSSSVGSSQNAPAFRQKVDSTPESSVPSVETNRRSENRISDRLEPVKKTRSKRIANLVHRLPFISERGKDTTFKRRFGKESTRRRKSIDLCS